MDVDQLKRIIQETYRKEYQWEGLEEPSGQVIFECWAAAQMSSPFVITYQLIGK